MDREPIEVPGFAWPLALYVAISFVSTAFSPDPRVSLMADKQMVLYLLVPLVYRFATGRHASTMITVIVSFAAVSAVVGIVQSNTMSQAGLQKNYVLHVAFCEARLLEPSVVVPSKNVTVPVAVQQGDTVAVNVTDCPESRLIA